MFRLFLQSHHQAVEVLKESWSCTVQRLHRKTQSRSQTYKQVYKMEGAMRKIMEIYPRTGHEGPEGE